MQGKKEMTTDYIYTLHVLILIGLEETPSADCVRWELVATVGYQ